MSSKVEVKWYSYVAFAFIVVFFSGIFAEAEGPLRALDFSNLLGTFGRLGTLEEGAGTLATNFTGTGGVGARQGFMFALSLLPGLSMALGTVKVVESLGGLQAGAKLLNSVLKPLMGIPGICGIGLMTSLQSSDGGGVITKNLYDEGKLDAKERVVFVTFQMSAGSIIANFYGSGIALFPYITEMGMAIGTPLAVIFLFKIVGANLMRLYLHLFVKEAI